MAAHLAAHGEDRIDLRAFRYMLEEGRIVLLFDGFDELVTRVTYDRAAEHLRVLLDSAGTVPRSSWPPHPALPDRGPGIHRARRTGV